MTKTLEEMIAELRRLEAEEIQEKVARHLCKLMDDEWKLGSKLYMSTAKEILDDIALPELLKALEWQPIETAPKDDCSGPAHWRPLPSHPTEASMSVEELVKELRSWADCDARSGEPLGVRMRLAADKLEDLVGKLEYLAAENADQNEAIQVLTLKWQKAEAQLAERGKPFIAAAEAAYWLLAWTWQSHLTGPGKPFDMSIFAPEARNMMTKAEQDLFDALSEIEP